MKGEYIGVVQTSDPLYRFLADEVMGRVLGFDDKHSVFDVYRLDKETTDWSVFHYAERRTFISFVGKFYGNKWLDGENVPLDHRAALMRREFDNLQQVRALGLDAPPHQAIRPLTTSEANSCVLIEDFAPGPDLGFYIGEAIYHGRGCSLYDWLANAARFLADLHNRSRTSEPVDETYALAYLDKIIDQLAGQGVISSAQHQRLRSLRKRWTASQILNLSHQVLIHGDAKSSHFIFDGEHDVTVIDWERMRIGDRAADVGQVVAELKHRFLWRTGNPWASEPYIRHFYACYASYLPADEDITGLTERGRFYMGCFEARTGWNPTLDLGYRQRLVEDAEACLKI